MPSGVTQTDRSARSSGCDEFAAGAPPTQRYRHGEHPTSRTIDTLRGLSVVATETIHTVAEAPLHPSQHLNLVDSLPRRHADREMRIDMAHCQPKIRLPEGVSTTEPSPVALRCLTAIVPHMHGKLPKRTHMPSYRSGSHVAPLRSFPKNFSRGPASLQISFELG